MNTSLRNKKKPKFVDEKLSKEKFLERHNDLSPLRLKATIPLLSRFKLENSSLFKDDYWYIDKIRKPFVIWLISEPWHIKK